MKVNELFKKRYAVKLFNGEKICSEDLKELKQSILLAPSSFNLQPWKVKIIDDKELLKKLQEASWNQPQIGSCSHLFVFCSYLNLDSRKEDLYNLMKDKMDTEKFEGFRNMLEGYWKSQSPENLARLSEREVFMALENLILSATDLGYGSCPIGGFSTEKFKEILGIEDNLNPVVICPVGISADSPREKLRFEEEKVFF